MRTAVVMASRTTALPVRAGFSDSRAPPRAPAGPEPGPLSASPASACRRGGASPRLHGVAPPSPPSSLRPPLPAPRGRSRVCFCLGLLLRPLRKCLVQRLLGDPLRRSCERADAVGGNADVGGQAQLGLGVRDGTPPDDDAARAAHGLLRSSASRRQERCQLLVVHEGDARRRQAADEDVAAREVLHVAQAPLRVGVRAAAAPPARYATETDGALQTTKTFRRSECKGSR